MTEAVAVPKPGGKAKSGSGKTTFAGILVFILLVAFAAAFYLLGGVELVSGVVGGLFSAAQKPSAPTSSGQQKAPAASVVPSSSSEASATGLRLPDGVDEAFARRVYAEQIESRVNIEKLATDKIGSFEFGKAEITEDEAIIPVTAKFRDGTTAPGEFLMARKAGKWYLEWAAGRRPAQTDGLADTVARNTQETDPAHAAAAAQMKVDEDVLSTMLEQQAANQEVVSAVVDSAYTSMTVDGLTENPGTATLDVTFKGANGAAVKGRILCITKDIDGRQQWFVTSFTKA